MIALVNNIAKGFFNKLGKKTDNPYSKIGLSWLQSKHLKNIAQNTSEYNLFGSKVYFTNKHELFHAIDEIFINEIYKINLPDNALILDCGANIGMSVIYLKLKHTNSRIIAFEPDETNFSLLEKNINSLKINNVTPVKKAIWKETGSISFESQGTMSSKISDNNSHLINNESSGPNFISMPTVRLKEYLNETVHFLKLDIEGAEYEVLKDCSNNLNNVLNMFIEFHGTFEKSNELIEILTILQDNNFKYYIKEAHNVYPTPFLRNKELHPYEIQLNIFAFKD